MKKVIKILRGNKSYLKERLKDNKLILKDLLKDLLIEIDIKFKDVALKNDIKKVKSIIKDCREEINEIETAIKVLRGFSKNVKILSPLD